jgi:hypothetical protein
MIGDLQHRNQVKKQYDFSDWSQGKERPQWHGAALQQTLMPLSPQLIERMVTDGLVIYTYSVGDKATISVWHYQKFSPSQAQEALLDFLMENSSPQLPPAEDKGISVGDVAFAGHTEVQESVVFTRDHHFLRIHSVGIRPYDVGEFAVAFDQALLLD